jgi:hypothetical protein
MRINELTLTALGSLALAFAACDRGPDDTLDRNAFANDGDASNDDVVPPEEDDDDDDDEDEDEDDEGGEEEDGGDDGCEDEGGVGEESGGGGYGCDPIASFDLDRLAQYVEGDNGVIVDCSVDQGYSVSSWRAAAPGEEQLWVAGVYETRGDHGFDYHPMGAGTVTWSQPGDNVLVLGAYEPTTWTVTVEAGASLSRIIAIGYHEQIVDAPEGVEIEVHTIDGGMCEFACGYALPGDGGGCDGEVLIGVAEHLSGRTMTAFDGCYQATEFAF